MEIERGEWRTFFFFFFFSFFAISINRKGITSRVIFLTNQPDSCERLPLLKKKDLLVLTKQKGLKERPIRTNSKYFGVAHAYAEASLHYLQLRWRGCWQISTWVWFWRTNRPTILWNCVHHSQRCSPGSASRRGRGQISTWVWFWRRNRSTILWNCVHHSRRRSPSRANRLAVENQHSQKRHLYDFRDSFPPHLLPHHERRT